MDERARRALEQGRSMVARQKAREDADMQIPSGDGKKFTRAERVVMDMTSNPRKNVELLQAAFDAEVAERAGTAEKVKELEDALREAGEKLVDATEQLEAARGQAATYLQERNDALDRLQAIDTAKAAEVPAVTGSAPAPEAPPAGDEPAGQPPTETPNESESAPAPGAEQDKGEFAPAGTE